jgi:hypothetical protein
MSKSFVFDRFDVHSDSDGYCRIKETQYAEGEYVKAQDAIDRDEVLKAQIRVLELQLREAKLDAESWRALMLTAGSANESHVHIIGAFSYMPELPEAGRSSWPMEATRYDARRAHIRQAVFRWVDTGNSPTLTDGLRLVNKESDVRSNTTKTPAN